MGCSKPQHTKDGKKRQQTNEGLNVHIVHDHDAKTPFNSVWPVTRCSLRTAAIDLSHFVAFYAYLRCT